ncbi:MAG: globin [Gammaproteobacteria bacterium]|nr:MAG: globin [Gammaproteobacteria bacterium]
MNDKNQPIEFGKQDASYSAAGKIEGIRKLVDSFYQYMDRLDEAKIIRAMHPKDLTVSSDKLACFLSGWLGGPRLYSEKYGSISIPMIHKHLSVASAERDAWLLCMKHAANDQPYHESFKKYLLEQLFVPAERIRQVSK